MPLEQEQAFFEKNRQQWISAGHEDDWAVVHGDQLHGFFKTIGTGYDAGVKEFGAGNFLLKQITPTDEIETIQRMYWGASAEKQAG